MLIVCPSCATSYDVELPPQGRQVRCLRCRTVWRAEPSHADKLLAAAAAIASDHDVAADAPDPFAAAAVSIPAAESEGPRAAAWSDQSAAEPDDDPLPADIGSPPMAANESDPTASAAMEEGPAVEPYESGEVESPPTVPIDLDEDRPPIDINAGHSNERGIEPPENIETVAARRQRRSAARRAARWPLSGLQTGILVLVLVDAILVGWRSDIARALPQTASFYSLIGLPVNLRGLTFDGIVTTTEQHEGVPILVVEGNIVNDTRKIVDVPRLKFVVRNAARQEIYSWTAVASRTMLPPGEAVSFRTRLASPPPDAHDLVLRFFTRRDLIAGAH
jgi:predicted Zn finger-like uncharacterized protein